MSLVADNKLRFVEPPPKARDSSYSDVLRPLAAVAPQQHAARFTVVAAETLELAHLDEEAMDELEKAVRKAHLKAKHGGARMDNTRLVKLRINGPLVDEHGEVEPEAEPKEPKELQIVVMPLSDVPRRQLFFYNPVKSPVKTSWVTAAAMPGRGKLQFTLKSNKKAPSGWEAFDIVNFTAGGEGADAGAVEEVPSPEIKRQRTI